MTGRGRSDFITFGTDEFGRRPWLQFRSYPRYLWIECA
jgi:hypothetical protein